MEEENKLQLKGEVKALQESKKFQNETNKNMKKDMTEEKQRLETDNRNNEEVQNEGANRRITRQTSKK